MNSEDSATNISFASMSAEESTYIEDNGYYKLSIFNSELNRGLFFNISEDTKDCYTDNS